MSPDNLILNRSAIDRALDTYLHNQQQLAEALDQAGDSIYDLLDKPLREVLRTLAKNKIHIDARHVKDAS